ncbi:MAG: hypothetical protein JXA83_01320 [Acidimicrobiales bacterium]|nr:hypothetical protein [Acidimicrobiales bacterium]
MSLLDVLRGVMLDPDQQAAYNADPSAYLGRYGYDDVDPADLSEAFGLVADTLPPDQAQAAMSATAAPGDSSFGAVTADFDAHVGAGPGGDDPAPLGPDPDTDTDPDSDTDPDADADGAPALSFGEGGSDTHDLDDPTFDEEPLGTGHDLDEPGPDDSADTDLDDGLGPDDSADTGLDDGLGLSDGDVDGLGGTHADDIDDLGEIDGLGGHDPGPDDLDIGSF